MRFRIRYTDPKTGDQQITSIEAAMDVFAVDIPAQPNYCGQESWRLPALTVNVNSDAVIVTDKNGRTLGMIEFSEVVSEAQE